MLTAVLFGFVLGALGSIPVAGPISALVIARGIQGRFKAGAFIALGGGTVEAIYCFLAFWGFSQFLEDHPIIEPISRGVSALVLLVLGIVFIRKKHDDGPSEATSRRLRDSKRSSFFLGAWVCAINPTVIAGWSAVVTTVYSSGAVEFTSKQALPFAIGVAMGITSWFWGLLAVIRRNRERFSGSTLTRVLNAVGMLLVVLACWFAYRFVDYFIHPPELARAAAQLSRSPLLWAVTPA